MSVGRRDVRRKTRYVAGKARKPGGNTRRTPQFSLSSPRVLWGADIETSPSNPLYQLTGVSLTLLTSIARATWQNIKENVRSRSLSTGCSFQTARFVKFIHYPTTRP